VKQEEINNVLDILDAQCELAMDDLRTIKTHLQGIREAGGAPAEEALKDIKDRARKLTDKTGKVYVKADALLRMRHKRATL